MKKAKEIYEEVCSDHTTDMIVNYEWEKHKRLAEMYPDGKVAYYQKEMANLRERLTEGRANVIVKSWINSNFTTRLLESDTLFNYIDKLNDEDLAEDRKELQGVDLVKPMEECVERLAEIRTKHLASAFRSFVGGYAIYKKMCEELQGVDSETPEDDKPKFTRAGARAIFDKIRSLDMGWKNEKGKPCPGIKEDDPEPFICMVLHKKPTKKMTWTATTPKDKSKVYVKAIVEMMSLIGYSLEEISPSAKAGHKSVLETYFNNLINYDTLRTKKSEYEAGKHSPKYERLEQIINAHKSN